jgi:DNA-binding CsgD family transcriptional regulator/quercetin dioxygenase-like cupin family protein
MSSAASIESKSEKRSTGMNPNWSGALSAALGSDSAGIVVIDRARRILFSNDVAEAVLESDVTLFEKNQRLLTRIAAVELRLKAAMRAATGSPDALYSQPQILSLPRRSGLPLLVLIVPVPLGSPEDPAVLMLFWAPESVPVLPSSMLQQLFDLTPSEALTALATYAGETPAEIARGRRRSITTIRTLLSRVFAKCGVQRQAELIRLLAGIDGARNLAEGINIGIRIQESRRQSSELAVLASAQQTLASKLLPSRDMQTLVRIKEFAPGTGTPLHYQTQGHEVVCVTRGEMTTRFGSGEIRSTPRGQAIYVGDNILHRGQNPSTHKSAQVLVINVVERGRAFQNETPVAPQ